MRTLNEDLIYEILAVVDEIPKGKVVSYGRIAKLIGRPQNARLIGRVLSMADHFGDYPCHRVVNAQGRLVPGWNNQRTLLEMENITFDGRGYVNMKMHLWDGDM